MLKNTIFKKILVVFMLLALVSCAGKNTQKPDGFAIDGSNIQDLQVLPQDLEFYAKNLPNTPYLNAEQQAKIASLTLTRLSAPWAEIAPKLTAEQAFWANRQMRQDRGFIAKDKPFSPKDWEKLLQNSNEANYPAFVHKGITVSNTNLRAMPTRSPYFLNPRRAGEGYPFDYFQQTALWIGTPLLVTHISADKEWFMVETALASGWLPIKDIALVDEDFITKWQALPLLVVVQDNAELKAANLQSPTLQDTKKQRTNTLGKAHIGTLLSKISENSQNYTVLLPLRQENGQVAMQAALINHEQARPYPLPTTAQEIAKLGNQMMGQTYGWGGIDEKRDCSALTHDLLLSFGIWLPRNSAKQAERGLTISLKGLDESSKQNLILQKGLPFFSLLWLQGHVGLYIGEYNGKPLLFHNVWGVRLEKALPNGNKQQGRAVIGKAVVTTLNPGVELPLATKTSGYLGRIQLLTILPEREGSF